MRRKRNWLAPRRGKSSGRRRARAARAATVVADTAAVVSHTARAVAVIGTTAPAMVAAVAAHCNLRRVSRAARAAARYRLGLPGRAAKQQRRCIHGAPRDRGVTGGSGGGQCGGRPGGGRRAVAVRARRARKLAVAAATARGDAGRAACSRNGSDSAKQSAAGAALGRQLPRRRRWSHAERMLGLGREFARCGRGQARGTSAAAAGEGQRTKGLFEPGHATRAPPRPLPGPLHRATKCTRLCHRLAVPADSWHAAVACAYGSRSGSRSRSGGGGGARRRGCTGVSRLRRPRGPGRGCGLRQQRGGRRGRDSGALQPALRCRSTSGRRV